MICGSQVSHTLSFSELEVKLANKYFNYKIIFVLIATF